MNIHTPEFAEWCFDNSVRIERTIILSGVPDEQTDDVRDFLEDVQPADFDRLFGPGSWKATAVDSEYINGASFVQFTFDGGHFGMLVQVARPVHKWAKDGKSASYSWGHCGTRWLYSADGSDLQSHMAAWAEAEEADEKAKPASK